MPEIVFDYTVIQTMNKAEKQKKARVITLDYFLHWDGKQWTIEDTATGKVANVYVSVV